jgi:hypothetical protein
MRVFVLGGNRALRPEHAFVGILQHLRGHFVVTHADLRSISIRAKLAHAARLIVSAVGVAHLEIQDAARDQPKKRSVAVQARPTEHAPRGDTSQAGELLQHIANKFIGNGHARRGRASSHLIGPEHGLRDDHVVAVERRCG